MKSGSGAKQASISDYQSEDASANLGLPHQTLHGTPIFLQKIETPQQLKFARNIVKAHHSYVPSLNPIGRSITYMIIQQKTMQTFGVIGAQETGTWNSHPRDLLIGWNTQQKKRNIHKVLDNYRFTLMPNAPNNIASKTLSIFTRLIKMHWKDKYQITPVLMTTNVLRPHSGTCYKAANWKLIGARTVGESHYGYDPTQKNHYKNKLVKNVFAGKIMLMYYYPLKPNWRQELLA